MSSRDFRGGCKASGIYKVGMMRIKFIGKLSHLIVGYIIADAIFTNDRIDFRTGYEMD